MKKMEKYTKRRLEIDTLLAYGESKELRRVHMRVCYPLGSRARLKLISSFRHPTPILALPSIRYPLHDRRRERKSAIQMTFVLYFSPIIIMPQPFIKRFLAFKNMLQDFPFRSFSFPSIGSHHNKSSPIVTKSQQAYQVETYCLW